jgi:hypothetical protein
VIWSRTVADGTPAQPIDPKPPALHTAAASEGEAKPAIGA